MAIRTAATIDTSSVTDAQIGAAHKVLCSTGNFYLVESATNPGTEYKVTYSSSKGFQCQCKASEYGNLCWHIKAALACEREVKQALEEMAAAIKAQAAKPVATIATTVDAETLARVQAACSKPAKVSKAKGRTQGFSLMR